MLQELEIGLFSDESSHIGTTINVSRIRTLHHTSHKNSPVLMQDLCNEAQGKIDKQDGELAKRDEQLAAEKVAHKAAVDACAKAAAKCTELQAQLQQLQQAETAVRCDTRRCWTVGSLHLSRHVPAKLLDRTNQLAALRTCLATSRLTDFDRMQRGTWRRASDAGDDENAIAASEQRAHCTHARGQRCPGQSRAARGTCHRRGRRAGCVGAAIRRWKRVDHGLHKRTGAPRATDMHIMLVLGIVKPRKLSHQRAACNSDGSMCAGRSSEVPTPTWSFYMTAHICG